MGEALQILVAQPIAIDDDRNRIAVPELVAEHVDLGEAALGGVHRRMVRDVGHGEPRGGADGRPVGRLSRPSVRNCPSRVCLIPPACLDRAWRDARP